MTRPGIVKQFGGVAICDLVAEFGTPLYVYNAQVICDRVEELRSFDRIRYAQKANSNVSILRFMRSLGVWVDAVSAGEIVRATTAGFAPPEIVFTADVFTADALNLVRRHGLRVNCGSIDMMAEYGRAVPGAEITLRINPGFGHGHSQKTNTGGSHSKHGVWHDELPRCQQVAREYDLRITGLHMHIGSGTDEQHLARVCEAMQHAVRELGPSVRIVSAGGGLPVPYRAGDRRLDLTAYQAPWQRTRQALERELGHPISLEVEPGRYLVAESGWFIAEIRSVKHTDAHGFYLLDAGFNALVRPAMYGAWHEMSICRRQDVRAKPDAPRPVIVAGPLCESGDVFTQAEGGVVLPRALPPAEVGDWLVIHDAGAYGMSMASNYNSYPLPAEVLIRDGRAELIRRRQTLEEMLAPELLL